MIDSWMWINRHWMLMILNDLVAAEHEYESLLGGENAGGKKSKSNLIGSGPSPANLRKIATVNPQTGIPADRYDYSKVQHLNSTDI